MADLWMTGLHRVSAPSFFCLALAMALAVALRAGPGDNGAILVPPWIAPDAGLQATLAAGGELLSVEYGGRVIRAKFGQEAVLKDLYSAGMLVVRVQGLPCSSGAQA